MRSYVDVGRLSYGCRQGRLRFAGGSLDGWTRCSTMTNEGMARPRPSSIGHFHLPASGPTSGRQLSDLGQLTLTHARQNVQQVSFDGNRQPPAGFDYR